MDREHCYEIPSQAIVYALWKKHTLPKIKREAEAIRIREPHKVLPGTCDQATDCHMRLRGCGCPVYDNGGK